MDKKSNWFSKAAIPAALFMLGMGSGTAQASAYAVSTNSISSFNLGFVGTSGSLFGFTSSADTAVQGTSNSGFSALDAPAACVGAACVGWSNQFFQHGASGSYAYGDAQISNANVLTGMGSASTIAEISTGAAGFALGTNQLNGFITLAGSGNVSFSFDATPFMSATATGGDFSSALMSMSISLYNGSGQQVFNWTPNGTLANGIVGGTETLDASNLNTGITSVNTFSPASGSFAAQSFLLATGTYTISIGMSNQVTSVTSVPEADSWAMLLAGLGLVGFAARRKLS
jgi:hypothetical protein